MAADISTYDKALKTVYGGIPTEELNQATPLWNYVKRTSRGFDGREFTLAVHGRRNQQIGARALTGAALPGASTQDREGYDNATYKPTQLLGVIHIEHSLMETSRTNEGAFVRALRSEVENMAKNFAVDFDRQLFGDGTGSLTVCGTTSASTSVEVVSTALLEVGMGIDVLVSAGGTVSTGAAGRTVSSITDADTFVISGAAITTDNTFSVYRAGSYSMEVNGLQNIVKATGALGGLNPATAGQEYWQSFIDSATTTVSEKALQKLYEAPQEQKRGGGGKANLAITTFGVRRSYQDNLVALKRFSAAPLRLVGGWEALDFNGLPIFAGRFAAAKRIDFLDTKKLFLLQTRDAHWVEDDGKILKWVSDTVGFKGIYAWLVQFATDARNAHSAATTLTES